MIPRAQVRWRRVRVATTTGKWNPDALSPPSVITIPPHPSPREYSQQAAFPPKNTVSKHAEITVTTMPVASDPISSQNIIQQATCHASSKHGEDSSAAAAAAVGPELPPAIAEVKNTTTEEFLKAMNKMPIFMTELDETGADGEENMELEALKALAYEGEPHEVRFLSLFFSL